MKKALIITNTASMVHLFNSVNMGLFRDEGYEVHIACNFVSGNTASKDAIEEYKAEWKKKGVISHHIDFLRSPFSLKSFRAYKETKELLASENYDIVHCHTPIVSVFTRHAIKKLNQKPRLVYTAHGFHFYKGCSLFNWLTYYPIEKHYAKHTDVLITINEEDHERAEKHMKARQVAHIKGVGIDTKAIGEVEKDVQSVRKELGIADDQLIIASVGEINQNKNHKTAIEAIAKTKHKNIQYIIAGIGHDKEKLIELAEKLGVGERVHFIGFRNDVYRILKAADIFVFPSFREGLSVALMEAMACEMAVVASKIRGNVDLIDDGKGGFLCNPHSSDEVAAAIDKLGDDPQLRASMGAYNDAKIKEFDVEKIVVKLKKYIFGKTDEEIAAEESKKIKV